MVLFFSFNCLAQDTYLPYSIKNKTKKRSSNEYRNLEFTVGYIPNPDYNSVKANIALNSLVLKCLGGYTTVAYDLSTHDYINTVGGTLRIHKYGYLWGGMDLFTSNGLIQADFSHSRKEIGIGITPYKITAFRFGWSNSVGISFSVGLYIPF